MADTTTGSTGFDLTALYQFIQGINGTDTSNAATAAAAADPFASQRGQYQQQLSDLMKDPSSILKDPSFTSSLNLGGESLARQFGAQGMGQSGNVNAALDQYGTSFAQSAINNKISQLTPLTGATSGSPAAAGALIAGGQKNTADSIGGGLSDLDSILGQIFGSSATSGIGSIIKQIFSGMGGGSGIDFGSGFGTDVTGNLGIDTGGAGGSLVDVDTGVPNITTGDQNIINDIFSGNNIPDLDQLFAGLGG